MTVACNPAIVFQMTVARNPAIALVLVLVSLLSDSKKYCVIALTIRNKQSIGVGLTSKSSKPVKPSVVLVLVRVTPFFFKATDVIGFTFAPHWFVKTGELLRDFHRFVVG